MVKDSVAAGGEVIEVGTVVDEEVVANGYFVRPRIVLNLPDDAQLVCEEQFGPLVPIQPYDSVHEVIARANATELGLAASVWSADEQQAFEVAQRIEAGFVFINKVPGNFHISGHHYPDAVQKIYMAGYKLDFSHKINHLSFGNINNKDYIERNFGDSFKFELDGRDVPQEKYMPLGGGMGFMGPTSLFVNYFLEISQLDYVDKTSQEAIDT